MFHIQTSQVLKAQHSYTVSTLMKTKYEERQGSKHATHCMEQLFIISQSFRSRITYTITPQNIKMFHLEKSNNIIKIKNKINFKTKRQTYNKLP
jgi:hypothetical protein